MRITPGEVGRAVAPIRGSVVREELIGGWLLSESADTLRLTPTSRLPTWPTAWPAGLTVPAAVVGIAAVTGGGPTALGVSPLAAVGLVGVSAFVGMVLANERQPRKPGRPVPLILDRATDRVAHGGMVVGTLAGLGTVWVRRVFGTGRARHSTIGHEVRIQTGPAELDEVALPLPRMARGPADTLARRVRAFLHRETPA